jgi:hypothetical protein
VTAPLAALAAPATAELAELERWLLLVRTRAAVLPPPRVSFLVVTPLGLPDRAWLWRTMSSAGVALIGREEVPSWPRAASALYVTRTDPEALRLALFFERAWEALFPAAPAEAWTIAPGSHARAEAVKHAARAGMRHVALELDRLERRAVLHPFHLADGSEADAEARRLTAARLLSAPPARSSARPGTSRPRDRTARRVGPVSGRAV